ncbi:MAG: hypothetical protein HN348_16520, partial [Proteobacteria bacterium]|nr:hypothetical protein [Pseudomonadota bacterium]
MLLNGANFPDGGYAIGDGYGEIAHWEPFQSAYLHWIADNYESPWSDEAAQHIAFLLGMASHGMSDQLYDGMYLKRAAVYDEGAPGTPIGGDGSTDVSLASKVGYPEFPDTWVPADVMAGLMLDAMGHKVDADTISAGQGLLDFSLAYVAGASEDPSLVLQYAEAYPWASAHQTDETVPGSPVTTAPVVAAYWQFLWSRLHDEDHLNNPLLARFPRVDSDRQVDETGIEAMVSFVVARGLHSDTVGTETIAIEDSNGHKQDLEVQLYYGHNSHVINLQPTDSWSKGLVHQVSVGPGLSTWDDEELGEFAFSFDAAGTTPQETAGGCACGLNPMRPIVLAPWLLLLVIVCGQPFTFKLPFRFGTMWQHRIRY